MEKAKKKRMNFYMPVDVVVADDFSNDANIQVVSIEDIPSDWEGLDAGPKTREIYADVIKNSKLVILEWTNGCI